jgi:mono/diheme cytochrome c family protein
MQRTNVYPLILLAAFAIGLLLTPTLNANIEVNSTVRTAGQVYSRYCVSCHGRDGKSQTSKGRFSHARDLTEAKWQDDVTDERIYNSIMNGRNVRGQMPAFNNKLNDKEVDSLVGFVRALRK